MQKAPEARRRSRPVKANERGTERRGEGMGCAVSTMVGRQLKVLLIAIAGEDGAGKTTGTNRPGLEL